MEQYADAGADVDRTLLEPPEPPAVTRLGNRVPIRGEAEISVGRYFGRRVHARAIAPLTGGHSLRASFDYVGSSGMEVPGSGPETVKNAADDFAGRVEYERTWSGLALGAWLQGNSDSYNLYGLIPGESSLVASAPDRSAGHIGGGVRLASGPNNLMDFEVEFGAMGEDVETTLFPDGQIQDPNTARSESRGFLTASVEFPAGSGGITLEVAGETAGVDETGFLGSSVQQGEASLTYRATGDRLRYHVGARLLTTAFDGRTGGKETDDRRSAVYLSPELDVRYAVTRSLEVFAANSPEVVTNRLGQLFAANPFLVSAPAMQPSISSVDARAGANLSTRDLRAAAWAYYQRSPNMLFFENSAGTGAGRVEFGYFSANYAEATRYGIGGEVGWSMRSGVQFSVGGKLVKSDLVDVDSRIPYVPSFEAWIGTSVPFLDTRGLFQATGRYFGSRYGDVAETVELDSYLGIDLYAHYDFLHNVGVVVRLDNLSRSGRDVFWDGYPQRTNVFMIGARFLW
jgi:hypothetical protein